MGEIGRKPKGVNKIAKYVCGGLALVLFRNCLIKKMAISNKLGSRGHDRMVVGCATTYAISAYHH